MIVHQIQTDTVTVFVFVKCLVKPEYLIFNFVYIESTTVVRHNQLANTIFYLSTNRNNRYNAGLSVFDGISNKIDKNTFQINSIV